MGPAPVELRPPLLSFPSICQSTAWPRSRLARASSRRPAPAPSRAGRSGRRKKPPYPPAQSLPRSPLFPFRYGHTERRQTRALVPLAWRCSARCQSPARCEPAAACAADPNPRREIPDALPRRRADSSPPPYGWSTCPSKWFRNPFPRRSQSEFQCALRPSPVAPGRALSSRRSSLPRSASPVRSSFPGRSRCRRAKQSPRSALAASDSPPAVPLVHWPA